MSTTMSTCTTNNDTDVIDSLPSGCPDILNRSSWNAWSCITRDNLTTLPVKHIVVHHVWSSIMNQEHCIAKIKELQVQQMDSVSYDDIGYNFMICGDKDDEQQIYTGRGWKYMGAHCKGYNTRSLGIAIMGNYTSIKSLNTFKSLIQCGIKKNDTINNFTLVGHEDSKNIYEYYLKYFRNDPDLRYTNQIGNTQEFCQ